MGDFAELEIGLYRADDTRVAARFRFWEPGSTAESNLGVDLSPAINLDAAALLPFLSSSEEYGKALAAQLLCDQVARAAMGRAQLIAHTLNAPLRMRLFIEPAAGALQAFRWETLYDLERGTRLCTDENVLFSRFLSAANTQPFEPRVIEQMRSLVLISNPSDLADYSLDPIDVQGQLERAKTGMVGMDVRALASGGQATLDNLVAALRDDCDILYLVAHGRVNGDRSLIYLEKPDGTAQAVKTEDLITRLGELRELPLLAILISCQSAGIDQPGSFQVALGPRLAGTGIPAVLAMQGDISFPTMDQFLPVFFEELQRDGQLDRAMAVARGKVRDRQDWWIPVLFSRLRDNQVLRPIQSAKPILIQYFEPETVPVPAGKFWMGRDPGSGVPMQEIPRQEVDLPAYRIGKYPITNRQFAEFVRATRIQVNPETGWDGQTPPPDKLEYPITGVTWYQAVAYCVWLSQKTGRKYTLPNEAQWEKAARGTQGWLYPWGDTWQEGRCNPDALQITPVGKYPTQGPYGCFDLIGNLREWTCSLWGEKRSEPDAAYSYPWRDDGRNDLNANALIRRVFRGGASDIREEMTCTARNGFAPDKSGPPGKRHGFRVVLSVEA